MIPKSYAPFFRDGLLFLPDITLQLLIDVGLEANIAQSARTGLRLDDDRQLIGIISNKLEKALAELSHADIEAELTSRESRFMLSDIDEEMAQD